MASKILVIADATTEAMELILEALKTIHSDHLHIKVLLISRLFGASCRNLGRNILSLLMRDEEEALQRARHYFTTNDIPYDLRMTPGCDRQAVLKEVDAKEHDFLILQGEFAKTWRKDRPSTVGWGAMTEWAHPVWILGGPEDLQRRSVLP